MSEPLESRMARVEEWSEGHEQRCEDRYKGIHDTVSDLKGTIKDWQKALWGIVIAILGWTATQVYENLKAPPPQYTPPAISDRP